MTRSLHPNYNCRRCRFSQNARAKQGRSDIIKGLAAGVASGMLASAAMNAFQALWSRLTVEVARSHGGQSLQQGSPQKGIARYLRARGSDNEQDDATERFASALSEGMLHRRLTEREKDIVGTLSHYGFGIGTGALYGLAAELVPGITMAAGLPFGAFVWLAADEGIVPALGLSKSLTQYPLRTHAHALASHLVFGVTAELARRTLRDVL